MEIQNKTDMTEFLKYAMKLGVETVGVMKPPSLDPTVTPIPFILKPAGCEVYSLESLIRREKPLRIVNKVTMQSAQSFIEYIQRFKTPTTMIFADVRAQSIEAVIDFHGPDEPKWAEHTVSYKPQFSMHWERWAGQSGKPEDQTAFAEFIEENRGAVTSPIDNSLEQRRMFNVAPDLASLLEMTRNIQGKSEVAWKSRVVAKDGSVSLSFVEDASAGTGESQVPIFDSFEIMIPIFYGSDPVRLICQFRYRIENRKLKLFYVLYRKDEIAQAGFEDIVSKIATGLDGTPVVAGKRQ